MITTEQIANKLESIELKHKRLFDSFFKKYPPIVSELTFSSIFTWKDHKCKYSNKNNVYLHCFIEGHLFIGFLQNEEYYLYSPIGPDTINIMNSLPDIKWISVHTEIAEKIVSNHKKTLIRDSFDYVYLKENMINLNNKGSGCFRRHVERCKRLYKITVRFIDQNNIKDCFEMNQRWLLSKNKNQDDADYQSIVSALIHYQELNLFGLIFIIDGSVVGFRIGETLNENTHVSHFAKHTTIYTGLGEYMLHALAVRLDPEIVYINLEQDMGELGLRKHKQMLCPVKMIEKYFYI